MTRRSRYRRSVTTSARVDTRSKPVDQRSYVTVEIRTIFPDGTTLTEINETLADVAQRHREKLQDEITPGG